VNNGSLTREQMGRQVAEVAMAPGDALYVRAGVPHVCHTSGDHSLHVSFDLGDKTPSAKQITKEANARYDNACAKAYVPPAEIVDRYVELLRSDTFQKDLVLATQAVRDQAVAFRARIGKTGVVTALEKFARA